MTTEERIIHEAAQRYAREPTERNLGELVTCVYNLPLVQWPENACQPIWNAECADEDLTTGGVR
jgi:hypothetical protein